MQVANIYEIFLAKLNKTTPPKQKTKSSETSNSNCQFTGHTEDRGMC